MKAVLLARQGAVTVIDRDVPEPEPGEVLIRTRASAIGCSDIDL
jgi:NADPH:quinone reductase-like Zn-dependent oxidoreductase